MPLHAHWSVCCACSFESFLNEFVYFSLFCFSFFFSFRKLIWLLFTIQFSMHSIWYQIRSLEMRISSVLKNQTPFNFLFRSNLQVHIIESIISGTRADLHVWWILFILMFWWLKLEKSPNNSRYDQITTLDKLKIG